MIYATSDLHGYPVDKFRQALEKAHFGDDDFLFVLGDVIDRGPEGAQLLRWLVQQPNMQLILGNHEAMLLSNAWLFDEVDEESLLKLTTERLITYQTWMRNGGNPTVTGLKEILEEDPAIFAGILDYLREAPLYEQVEAGGRRFVLVHSGLENFRPDRPLEDYSADELLWCRPGLDTVYYPDATVVFGHTPTAVYGEWYADRAIFTKSWICIDTGSSLGGSPMLLRLDDGTAFYWE